MTVPVRLEPAFPVLDAPFVHGITTADAPDLKSDPAGGDHAAAVAAVARELGLTGVGWARQVHGATVLRVEGPGCAGEADALWCDRPGLGVMGRSADCPIVLVAGRKDDGAPIWGMAHASWRSTASGVVGALMSVMTAHGLDAAAAGAVIGPSAGPCCYDVRDDVAAAFREGRGAGSAAWFTALGDRYRLDLWGAARDDLTAAGLSPESVALDGRCTICGAAFPSFRREGDRAGRFGLCLGAVTRPDPT